MKDSEMVEYLSDIRNKIQDGQVALFLGAGATCAAGGPDSKTLIANIKLKFPKIDQSLTDFFAICQDVLDTPPYSRPELEDFLFSQFNSLTPTDAHILLTKYNWATIFTTNYDDLIEVAFRESNVKIKKLKPIYSDIVPIQHYDPDYLYLYNIMGSIRARDGESGHMVLSDSDFRAALINRKNHLNTLYDIIKDGNIIFIGYSFNDRIVFEVIDDLIKEKTIDNLRWSYALFPEVPEMDEKTKHKFSRRRIIPIQCDFKKFFEYLDKKIEKPLQKSPVKNEYIKLKEFTLKISYNDSKIYSEQFQFLTESLINQDRGDKDDFFLGKNQSWGAFFNNWDFLRENYQTESFPLQSSGKISLELGGLRNRVFEELKRVNIEENKVFLLKGMAGVGKTLALRRLAYDVYQSHEAPVILLDKTKVTVDYKTISTFIEDINQQVNQQIANDQKKQQIKLLVIIDDAASVIRHINALKNYLSSRGRPALIIAAERTNMWDAICDSYNAQIPPENIFNFSEKLTADEKLRIIDHFYNLGYIPTKDLNWDGLIDGDFENSYFATIYTLVHPSKQPLNEIIKNQYTKLPDLTKEAFKYICLFHQFDLPINFELLVRTLKCSWDTFYSEVKGSDSNKVIFEEQDMFGNILFRSHHRIIAQKTTEFFFGDPEEQKENFIKLFQNAMLNNRKEREIVEKILVNHIGPNVKPQIFTYNQQRQMFQTICEKNPIRTLIHHWGVLESDDRNFPTAEKLLIKALEMPRYDIESYRGESDQNIKTTLGSLYTKMGMDALKGNDPTTAKIFFKKAEFQFHGAKHGDFPNVLAYHAHAHMWYMRGQDNNDPSERLLDLTRSLEILSVAKDNLNEEDLKIIFELEGKVWAEIGNKKHIQEVTKILSERYNTAKGYYLVAEFYNRKSRITNEPEKGKLLRKAMDSVVAGLEEYPQDEHCLRLQSKLIKQIEPKNIKKYYRALQKWEASATLQNAILLFELGRISFILGYYDYSKKYFEKLQKGVGLGLKQRSRPQDPILDGDGNRIVFEGRVVNIFSPNEGLIRCDTLKDYREPISFRPVASKHSLTVDDNVTFYIEFSYRGPRAENVKKS